MTVPKAILAKIRKVTAKRPRTVLDHILKHGHITTQELKDLYGYNHPPRAARDVREQGIELETFRVQGTDGRSIAAYRLSSARARRDSRRGRIAFPKALKDRLVERDGLVCRICSAPMHSRYLQIDHRVPYDLAGDIPDPTSHPERFMLLCGPCNRAKSWSCEHCPNRQSQKDVALCASCYWATPDDYTHVALVPQRRAEVSWTGDAAVAAYETLKARARREGLSLPDLLLRILNTAATSADVV
jgi:hypothetical protein